VVSPYSKTGTCPIEIIVHNRHVQQLKDEESKDIIPDFKKFSFDIECDTNGKRFPRKEWDRPCRYRLY
jgi:hypothetical protein